LKGELTAPLLELVDVAVDTADEVLVPLLLEEPADPTVISDDPAL